MIIEVHRRKKPNSKVFSAILFAVMPLSSAIVFLLHNKIKTKRNFKKKSLLLVNHLKEVNTSRQKPRTIKAWAF